MKKLGGRGGYLINEVLQVRRGGLQGNRNQQCKYVQLLEASPVPYIQVIRRNCEHDRLCPCLVLQDQNHLEVKEKKY